MNAVSHPPGPSGGTIRNHADVAQLVEHRFCKPDVAGSIPAVGSSEPPDFVPQRCSGQSTIPGRP